MTAKSKIDKKVIKIAMKVLDEVKEHFTESIKFIEDCIEQECSKENISVDEVIFPFTCLAAKS